MFKSFQIGNDWRAIKSHVLRLGYVEPYPPAHPASFSISKEKCLDPSKKYKAVDKMNGEKRD